MNVIDVSVNGKWLSEEIPGLVVTSIDGRELHSRDVREEKIKGVNGAVYLGSEYPLRKLKVEFFIRARNNSERGSKYNQLASLLNFEEGQIIFSDEPDKYFVGTPTDCGQRTMCFECTDPFKYSTTLKSFNLKVDNTFTIKNNGAVPVSIRYEFQFPSDCGYIGIASDKGAMEFGKREELDIENKTSDQELLNWDEIRSKPTTSTPAWKPSDNDFLYPHTFKTVTCRPNKPYQNEQMRTYLELNRSGTNQGKWICGACKVIDLPADAAGETGALDWYIWSFHWFEAGVLGQVGEQAIHVLDVNNNMIAEFKIFKTDTSGNTGHISFAVLGKRVKDIEYRCSWAQAYGSGNRGYNDIQKRDDWIEFYYNGSYYRFHDPALRTAKASKIQITIADNLSGSKQMSINRIADMSFTKYNVNSTVDVKNTFGKNDILVVDGETGKCYKNGQFRPSLEILGTEYFEAEPGETKIQVATSSWFTGTITATAYIREAWL